MLITLVKWTPRVLSAAPPNVLKRLAKIATEPGRVLKASTVSRAETKLVLSSYLRGKATGCSVPIIKKGVQDGLSSRS